MGWNFIVWIAKHGNSDCFHEENKTLPSHQWTTSHDFQNLGTKRVYRNRKNIEYPTGHRFYVCKTRLNSDILPFNLSSCVIFFTKSPDHHMNYKCTDIFLIITSFLFSFVRKMEHVRPTCPENSETQKLGFSFGHQIIRVSY